MFGDAFVMVVTRRSSRFRAFRTGAPAFASGVWFHGLARSCSNVLLGGAAVGGIVIVAAVLLGASRPAWWRDAFASAGVPRVERVERARKVDNNSWSLVTQVRPMAAVETRAGKVVQSEPWSVSITAESATAWLNEKLPQWLNAQENPIRLPAGAEMQAGFEPGLVRLGLRVPAGGLVGGERYLALTLRPRVDEKGLWLPAAAASVGRLDLPVAAVLPRKEGERDGGEVSGLSRELSAVLRGRAPALADALIRLPDGRAVRLLRFEVVADRLVLTMRTESRR